MKNEFAKHEKDYIRIYEEKGYTSGFHFKEGKLISNTTSNAYTPQDLTIVAEHRYEGMSNPSDMSLLYVVETNKDEKGTLLLGYGPSANLELSEFIKEIPEENITNSANINTKKD